MKRGIIILLLSFVCLASATPDRPVNAGLAKHALVIMRAKKTSESKETGK